MRGAARLVAGRSSEHRQTFLSFPLERGKAGWVNARLAPAPDLVPALQDRMDMVLVHGSLPSQSRDEGEILYADLVDGIVAMPIQQF